MSQYITTFIITILSAVVLIESRHLPCTLQCPIGQMCVLRRSTCSYPPCKKFPVCMPDESTSSEPQPIRSESHPGVCIIPTIPGPCMEQCQTDSDCRGHEKCCYNGCGKTCTAPGTVQVTKPGTCPRRLSSESLCGMDCTSDNDCPGVEKCCITACGSTCSRPCYYWLWTLPNRATGTRSAFWSLSPQCRHL